VLLDKVIIDAIAKDTANGKVWEEFVNKYSLARKGVPLSEYVIRCSLLTAGAYIRWLAELVLLMRLDEPEDLPGCFWYQVYRPPFWCNRPVTRDCTKLQIFPRHLYTKMLALIILNGDSISISF
jgi:hypothetical protein